MRLLVTALILGALGSHTTDVFALNQTFSARMCNACTPAQREQMAIGQGGQSGTMRYVDDLSSGILYKYMVEREPIAGGYTYYVTPYPVEPEYQDVVTNVKALWDLNGHRLTYSTTINATAGRSTTGPAGSAFDVVDPGPGRNNTITWLMDESHWPVSDTIIFHYQLIIGAGFRMVQGTPITITFDVHFPDGSKADFIFTYPDNQVTYVDKSAVDSKGNPIPQTRDDVVRGPGNNSGYDYRDPEGPDWNRAIQRFNNWGIPIGPGYYWACTRDPVTGINCVHVY